VARVGSNRSDDSLIRPRLGLLLTAGLCVGTLGLGTSASGAVRSVDDPVGDAPVAYDINQVIVRNDAPRLKVRTHYQDLMRQETQILGARIQSVPGADSYVLHTVRRPGGDVTTKVWRYSDDGDVERLSCGAKSRWETLRNAVVVRIPQKCLVKQGRVVVNVYVGPGDGSEGDPADWTDEFRVPFD
jgi:hypothetical protein